MIGAIRSQVIQRSFPEVLSEGVGPVARKVAGLVFTILASLVSFVLLPVEAATAVSVGLIALFSFICCYPKSSPPAQRIPSPIQPKQLN